MPWTWAASKPWKRRGGRGAAWSNLPHWGCGCGCGDNFAWRTECYRCGKAAPAHVVAASKTSAAGGSSGGGKDGRSYRDVVAASQGGNAASQPPAQRLATEELVRVLAERAQDPEAVKALAFRAETEDVKEEAKPPKDLGTAILRQKGFRGQQERKQKQRQRRKYSQIRRLERMNFHRAHRHRQEQDAC